ncbi:MULTISPECIES: hypothetical protein [Pseudomonas]|uniref:glycosyltransferase n=1 Tax=Pseudomonas TaxID=286 RepID=UPI0006974C58|nr:MULTISPECIES: hypothetical protein [Pseudomonas]
MPAKKILIFAEAVTLAHLVRPYQLAKVLVQSGYRVHFASADRFQFVFDQPDIEHHWIESVAHGRFLERVETGRCLYSAQELIDYVGEEVELIRRLSPDLVMGDFRHSLSISTRLARALYINLINAYWSPWQHQMVLPVPQLRQVALHRIPGMKHVMPLMSRIIFHVQGRALNQAREHFGLPPFSHCLHGWTFGDHTAYYDVPAHFDLPALPANHHFIGHVPWQPTAVPPSDQLLDGLADPFVYVALGSSAGAGVLGAVVERLMRLGLELVVSGVAKQDRPASWDHKVRSAPLVAGEVIARRASLVITNGGSPSSYQALAAGTPVLGVAVNMDQLLAMSNLQRLGGGYLLRPGEIASGRFDSRVQSLLNGECQHSVRVLAEQLGSMDYRQQLPQLVQRVIDFDDASASRESTDASKRAEQASLSAASWTLRPILRSSLINAPMREDVH